jgi:hypothetical protein
MVVIFRRYGQFEFSQLIAEIAPREVLRRASSSATSDSMASRTKTEATYYLFILLANDDSTSVTAIYIPRHNPPPFWRTQRPGHDSPTLVSASDQSVV